VGSRDDALLELGRLLEESHYEFVTITPESHRRHNRRPLEESPTARDIFGWSRPFQRRDLPPVLYELCAAAGILIESGGQLVSAVRFSTANRRLFVHSAYPTIDSDSVFFGPDTYRYLRFLGEAAGVEGRLGVDIGCGSGAGGIAIAGAVEAVVLTDINPRALQLARINTRLADTSNVAVVAADVLKPFARRFDLVISNPPYLRDHLVRAYRDGGGKLGEGLSVRIVESAAHSLRSGGRLLLYTATAIVAGHDTFQERIEPVLRSSFREVRYEEIDPDVFGEELERAEYSQVDRLAVIGLDATRI
jgi:release factor glutamine methyltransferase